LEESEVCGESECERGFDGVGPGCFSDTEYMNTYSFRCLYSEDPESFDPDYYSADDEINQNENGLVGHNHVCYMMHK
jgi:hypothetical protein